MKNIVGTPILFLKNSLTGITVLCLLKSQWKYYAIDLQIDCILESFLDVLGVAFSTDEN